MVTSTGRPQEAQHSVRTRRTLALGALSVAVVIAAASASYAVLGFDLSRDRDSAGPQAGAVTASPSVSAPGSSTGTFGPGAPARPSGVQPSPEPSARVGDGVRLSVDTDSIDLDSGKVLDFASGEVPDLRFRRTYLEAWGPALQVRRPVAGPVSPDSCRYQQGSWATVVDASELTRGVLVCVRTNEERYGGLTVTEVERDAAGNGLVAIRFSYVVFD